MGPCAKHRNPSMITFTSLLIAVATLIFTCFIAVHAEEEVYFVDGDLAPMEAPSQT
jgi:hypothetical protein